MHGFSPNFSIYIPQEDLELIYVSGGIWQQLLPWKHFEFFGGLTFVDVPQPKPMYGFSPNFQGMLTKTGSRAE